MDEYSDHNHHGADLFEFGSNMKRDRLETRLGPVEDLGIAILPDYLVAFNKKSIDGTGKANIVPKERVETIGVLYGLTDDQLKELDKSEGGYVRVPITITSEGKEIEAQTYVAMENRIDNNLLPTAEYLGYLIDGAEEHSFPDEYQKLLKSFGVCK